MSVCHANFLFFVFLPKTTTTTTTTTKAEQTCRRKKLINSFPPLPFDRSFDRLLCQFRFSFSILFGNFFLFYRVLAGLGCLFSAVDWHLCCGDLDLQLNYHPFFQSTRPNPTDSKIMPLAANNVDVCLIGNKQRAIKNYFLYEYSLTYFRGAVDGSCSHQRRHHGHQHHRHHHQQQSSF